MEEKRIPAEETEEEKAKRIFANLSVEKSKCHNAPIIFATINGLKHRVCKKCKKPVWQRLIEK
jgi:hypothetical protein